MALCKRILDSFTSTLILSHNSLMSQNCQLSQGKHLFVRSYLTRSLEHRWWTTIVESYLEVQPLQHWIHNRKMSRSPIWLEMMTKCVWASQSTITMRWEASKSRQQWDRQTSIRICSSCEMKKQRITRGSWILAKKDMNMPDRVKVKWRMH